jgi:hypothetical protein
MSVAFLIGAVVIGIAAVITPQADARQRRRRRPRRRNRPREDIELDLLSA